MTTAIVVLSVALLLLLAACWHLSLYAAEQLRSGGGRRRSGTGTGGN